MFEPQRFVKDYTLEQQCQFRDDFRTLAERYRRSRRIPEFIKLGGVVCFVLGVSFKPNSLVLPFAGLFMVFLVPVPLVVFVDRFRPPGCPACHNGIVGRFGPYCPECGAKALMPRKWFSSPRCSACGQTMRRSRNGRFYTIRSCTSCGVKLDGKGV
jgi:hypothetical protein